MVINDGWGMISRREKLSSSPAATATWPYRRVERLERTSARQTWALYLRLGTSSTVWSAIIVSGLLLNSFTDRQ
ncbi:uncharacterized protein L969DRAFT_88351 [Mixia osmundae IAM 14324]|uniref:uncharacterized protein n=1 Tax=Mixia osmundae (strain CBS 9802 / IAM 14324 / JCM 22182 / KY 12970) TaxID=764103 RepID=UPI0004A5564D|nr:uncharacterized protein L969DRAFT_88351 [Mixia osmundae IAM 14324]KEI38966.1 hypothetical protein L969DRAFT_88351 [Mixia osmundae IAM 14324]